MHSLSVSNGHTTTDGKEASCIKTARTATSKANSAPLAMIKLPAPAAMSVTTKPIMIIHETANNAMISLPPPANAPITMELVPPPETVVEQIDASTSISTAVEMDHPESNDSDMEEAEKSVTDEQICEVLNLPPPPKDPRLSKEN
eukprot:390712_1